VGNRANASQAASPWWAVSQARGVSDGITQVGAGEVQGGAQVRHAGVGIPRALGALRVAVDGDDIGDIVAAQRERQGQATLAAADDQHIENRCAGGMLARRHPEGFRMVQQIEIVRHPRFQFGRRYDLGGGFCHGNSKTLRYRL